LGSFVWELALGGFHSGAFACALLLGTFAGQLSLGTLLGHCCNSLDCLLLGADLWELSLCNLRLETCPRRLRMEALAGERSLGNLCLGTSLGAFRMGAFARKPSLGIFRLGTLA
jgi:hypothetical protein